MASDEKDKVAAGHFRLFEDRGEFVGIHLPAARIEENLLRGRVFGSQVGLFRADLGHLCSCVVRCATEEFFSDAVRVGVFGLSDVIKVKFQWPAGGIGTSFAARQRRSRS